MTFFLVFREFPHKFSANILVERAHLGFLEMIICIIHWEVPSSSNAITLSIHPNQLLPQLLPHLIWCLASKASLAFLPPALSPVYLYAVLRDTVLQKWIDLWVYIVGFIFFLICCVCISHSSLFNQKEWAIDCVYCGSKKRSCFKIILFANIDWPWNHLKSPTVCHMNI